MYNLQDILNKLNFFELTPIQEYNNILFKRDDNYLPFEDTLVSGCKVRQVIASLYRNYDYIKNKCGGKIIAGTSVTSTYGITITRVAREFGFKSTILMAKNSKHNSIMHKIKEVGGDVLKSAGLGFNSVISKKVCELAEKHSMFALLDSGIKNDLWVINNSTAYQAQNIPKDLDNLIVPVGRGVCFAGILRGLSKYRICPKRVIGVQISGYDRTNTIDYILKEAYPYELIIDKTYPYSKHVKLKFNNTEYLDPVYEAKAFKWMENNIDYKNSKTLFWIIGNNLLVGY